jgi:WD40 repeat protein
MLERFGYGEDIFISYASADATAYATALASRLQSAPHKLRVHIDRYVGQRDTRIPDEVRNALQRSLLLIVLGTPAALTNPNVAEEINAFPHRRRSVLVIAATSLQNAQWAADVRGIKPQAEAPQAFTDGLPSDAVVRFVLDSFGYRRQRIRQLITLTAIGIVTAAMLILAVIFGQQARNRQLKATNAEHRADIEQIRADQNASRADVEQHRADENASRARVEGQRADNEHTRADQFSRQAEEAAGRLELTNFQVDWASAIEEMDREGISLTAAHHFARAASRRVDNRLRATAVAGARFLASSARLRVSTIVPDLSGMKLDFGSRRLLTWTDDGTVAMWSLAGDEAPRMAHRWSHDAAIAGSAFSPDGRRMAYWGTDKSGVARIWVRDPVSGKLVGDAATHPEPIQGVTFSPDSRMMASWSRKTYHMISMGGHVQLWRSDRVVPVGPGTEFAEIKGATFSHDSRRLVVWGHEKFLVLDGRSSTQLASVPHPARIDLAVITRDDTRLVTANTYSDEIRVWDLQSYQEVTSPMHQDGLTVIDIDSNDRQVLAASFSHELSVWDLATGQQVARTAPSTTRQFTLSGARFGADAGTVTTWGGSSAVEVWDVSESIVRPRRTVVSGRAEDRVERVQRCGDETMALASSANHSRVWDLTTPEPVTFDLTSGESIKDIAISPRCDIAVVWSGGGKLRVWSLDRFADGATMTAKFRESRPNLVLPLRHSADAVAANNRDGVLTYVTTRPAGVAPLVSGLGRLTDVLTGPETRYVVPWRKAETRNSTAEAQSDEGRFWIIDTTRKEHHVISRDVPGLAGVVVEPGGRRVITWTADGAVDFWNPHDGSRVSTRSDLKPIIGGTAAKDGRLVLWGSAGYVPFQGLVGSAELIMPTSTAHGEPAKSVALPDDTAALVTGARFDRAERRIITWSGELVPLNGPSEGAVVVWNALTGRRIGKVLIHDLPVAGASWDGREQRILAWDGAFMGKSGSFRVWNMEGNCVLGPVRLNRAVKGAAFIRQDRAILAWTSTAAQVWDATTGMPMTASMYQESIDHAEFHERTERILTWEKTVLEHEDGTLRVWDARSGRPITPIIRLSGLTAATFVNEGADVLVWTVARGPVVIPLEAGQTSVGTVEYVTARTGTIYDPSTRDVSHLTTSAPTRSRPSQ